MSERRNANKGFQNWVKSHPEEANRNFKRVQEAVLSENREELRNIFSEGFLQLDFKDRI